MTRILIADDRPSMRIALKTLFVLRPSWEICGEAEDGREAISMAKDLRPDLIVMDFKMPLTINSDSSFAKVLLQSDQSPRSTKLD